MSRSARRPVHGVLLVDKAVGPSSHGVLGRARRLWRAEKGGHTGTLDPMASGLLPVCFGAATKFAQIGLESDKTYRATLTLGTTRVGGDMEGEVLRVRPVHATADDVAKILPRFTGALMQTPPMHSALKHEGRPLYELARAGRDVARAPRAITVHRLDVVSYAAPTLVLDVACSKGTYIRTLAEDLGEALGCGAHLAGLRRLVTAGFHVDNAMTLEAAEAMDEAQLDARLLPVDALLADAPALTLAANDAGRFLTGLRRRIDHADTPLLRVYGPSPECTDGAQPAFLGTGCLKAGELIATRLLSPVEVTQCLRTAQQPIDLPA